jgi:hypothetical protein
VVAKRLNEPYRPGERAWIKHKNRDYWRYEIEREGAMSLRRPPGRLRAFSEFPAERRPKRCRQRTGPDDR